MKTKKTLKQDIPRRVLTKDEVDILNRFCDSLDEDEDEIFSMSKDEVIVYLDELGVDIPENPLKTLLEDCDGIDEDDERSVANFRGLKVISPKDESYSPFSKPAGQIIDWEYTDSQINPHHTNERPNMKTHRFGFVDMYDTEFEKRQIKRKESKVGNMANLFSKQTSRKFLK